MEEKPIEVIQERSPIGADQVQVKAVVHGRNGLHQGRLIGVPAFGDRAVEAATRHLGEGRQPLALGLEQPGRRRRNRGGIQPATHHDAHRRETAEMIADDAVQHCVERLDVLLAPTEPDFALKFGLPVALHFQPLSPDGEPVPRWQTADAPVKGGLRFGRALHEHVSQFLLVDGPWDKWQREQPFGHCGKGKDLRCKVVQERRRGNGRTSGKEALLLYVRDGEGKDPDEMMQAVLSPLLPSAQDQFAVRDFRFSIFD